MGEGRSQPLVLIIEDQPDIVDLIDLILQRGGYQVLRAYNGTEGLELTRKHKPDVVLLDVMVPGLDGWEYHAAVRDDPELRHIPIIYVTARASAEERLRALDVEGAAAYIIKPFSPKELLQTIEYVLKHPDKQIRSMEELQRLLSAEEQQ